MFIPTWLLVLIVVVVVSVFLPSIWVALRSLATMLFGLLVIISIPATLYFVSQRDYQTALVVSLPLMPLAAWGLWTTTLETVQTSSWLHVWRVRAAAMPEAVETLRRRFADDLGLGRELFQFHDDVKHFPSWFSKTNPDGTPWMSNVIRQEEIIDFRSAKRTVDAGIDSALLDSGSGGCLVYSFVVEGKPYAFCVRDKGYASGFRHDEPGELFNTHAVWVIEKPNHIVLKADLSYHCGEYADSFHDAHLHSFKPGPWMPELLSIATRVHEDEREKHERWRKDQDRERAEKNFT